LTIANWLTCHQFKGVGCNYRVGQLSRFFGDTGVDTVCQQFPCLVAPL
jgi:hypothetical protein